MELYDRARDGDHSPCQTGRPPLRYYLFLARLLIVGLCWLASVDIFAREISGYASVRDDASLTVAGRNIRLFGIFVREEQRECPSSMTLSACATNAARALDAKIQGFVYCEPQSINRDRSINAICWVNRTFRFVGEDLGAYLLEQGWATALPNASYEYQVLEKVARTQGRGMWGGPGATIILE